MEERLVSYILGELSTEEQIELESEYFSDPKKYNLLRCVRDDLVDAYVDGRLSEEKRKQFELQLQNSPGHSRSVLFAEVLAKYISMRGQAEAAIAVSIEEKPASLWQSITEFLFGVNPVLQFSFAALVVIAMLGTIWLVREVTNLRTQVNELQAGQTAPVKVTPDPKLEQQIAAARSQADQLALELDNERQKRIDLEKKLTEKQSQNSEPLLRSLAFFLSPETLRSNDTNKSLIIPSGVSVIELKLNFKAYPDYKSYRVLISNANGDQIWNKDQVKVQKRGSNGTVSLMIPSNILPDDDYVIELGNATPDSDFEALNTYTFRILRK